MQASQPPPQAGPPTGQPAPPAPVAYQPPPQQQQQQQQQQVYQPVVPAAPAPAVGQPLLQQQQQQQLVHQTSTGIASAAAANYAAAAAANGQQPLQAQAHPGQPPMQQQQQRHFPHQGLNGGWQSDKDYQDRRKMIAKIVHLLQQRKPNAPQQWLKKLPQMAKRLEESLYRSAKSFDEYNDAGTLKTRLQQLAVNIGMKTKKMQQQQALLQQQQQMQQQQKLQLQQQQQLQQQGLQQQPTAQQPLAGLPLGQPLTQAAPPVVRPAMQPQPAAPPPAAPVAPPPVQQRLVNMADINPMIGQQQQQLQAQQQQLQAQQQQLQQAAAAATIQQPLQYAAAPQPAAPVAGMAPNGVPGATQPGGAASAAAAAALNGGRQVSDRQQVLRHQQQRLLLLRHAAKCQHEDGRCPVTPHCAGMKRLWKHIAECKNQKCLVPHCVSSRYVLSHYHRCKDVRCPVCGPVREAIHRSHEKQKQMQALKQRHQQAVQQTAPTIPGGATAQPQAVSAIPGMAIAAPAPGVAVTMSTPLAQQPAQPGSMGSDSPASKRRRTMVPGMQPATTFQAQHRPLPQQPTTIGSTIPVGQPAISSFAPAAYPSMAPASAASGLMAVPGQPGVLAVASQPGIKPPQVAQVPGLAFANGQVIMPKYTGPKPQEDHTLINCFSVEQIETHIASLSRGLQLPPQKLKVKCLEVLKLLQSHQHAWVFNTPVDPVELGLPDYFEVIKKPMDLGTIRKKLENNVYHQLTEFEEHVLLTFDNAMLYNPEGSVVYNMAKEMSDKFKLDYEKMMEQLNIEEDIKRRNGETCLLCGCEKLLFEPPVFYCNGPSCPSKRIRRNSYYYVGGNNQYHWCHQCFQELRDNSSIDLGDVTIKKEGLVKKKNDEVHEESWVQCDRCERWVHQICALFNTRQNKDQRSEYACPRCTIAERKKRGNMEATSFTPMAEDLPRTKLSEYLEQHVREKVTAFLETKAQEKSQEEQIPIDEARKKVEMGGAITIRQVTSMDRRLEVRERMKKRYAFRNYPDEFNFRCKCIVVFQNLDGVDVILFGLYVYEHDEKNPHPNTRTVYVSYLDSVHYMRPRQMRTFIYHEILISYLDYLRRRGFSTAHIWACPPLKGDDYILYAKPEDQKTPRDDRLRQWYIDMLVECQKRGIVGKLTNMHDLYFANEKNLASDVPYMDGDYFPAEVENIIKDIEEGKSSKKAGTDGKKKEKAKQKKKSGRGGTRSTGLDQDALNASGLLHPGTDPKSLEQGARDFVMLKLGETIQPMKDSFIVAFLAWKNAKPDNMVVPPKIQKYRDQHNIDWKLDDWEDVTEKEKAAEEAKNQKAETEIPTKPETFSGNEAEEIPSAGEVQPNAAGDGKPDEGNADTVSSTPAPVTSADAPPMEGVASEEAKDGEEKASDPSQGEEKKDSEAGSSEATNGADKKQAVNMVIREGKFAAMAARAKRDREGMPKEEEETKEEEKKEKEPKTITVTDSRGRLVKVLDDDDEELDCEFLNNRQAFLNLCQGNHYQFDYLRRAKHSSMMVLWHLHNRDAPKFVQQCATCSREILAGYRYHCPSCADFDQCQECISNPKVPRHQHQLKAIAVTTGQQTELTETQRQERQRSIQLHMTLLLHAATCSAAKCPSANCAKMKGLLKHGAQCPVKATGGCNVCKRIWALLQIHARQCKAKACPVPNCMAIRERVRQLKKQQQAMDDRRRQEMNRAYRGKR